MLSFCRPLSITLLSVALLACQQETSEPSAEPQAKPAIKSGVILANLDTAIKPQDDLYHFVNGNWLKTAEIPADRSSYGSFYILRDQSEKNVRKILDDLASSTAEQPEEIYKVKALYKTFMDEQAIEQTGSTPYKTLAAEIEQIGNSEELLKFMAKPWMQTGLAPMTLFVMPDKNNPEQYAVYLYQTGLSLPDRDYYFDDSERGQAILSDFQTHMATMFELAGEADPEAMADAVFELETQLAEGQWTRVEMRDAVKTYNPTKAEQLPQLYANIPWSEFISEPKFAQQASINVGQPSYLTHLDQLLAEVPLETWKTYLKWRTLSYLAPYLTADFATENWQFFSKTLYGTQEQKERWKRGVTFVSGIAGEAIGKLYVEQHFPPEAKTRMVNLVENLRTAYGESINNLDWMSEATKLRAIDKLEKFIPKIGYPDKWKDYSDLRVSNDSLADNVLAAAEFEYLDQVNKLGGPIDKTEWFMTPQTVNAYYSPLGNEIVFPAAILQPPFFDLNADDAINYGAIGGVIGHEMGHGFDDQGSRYNGDGKLDNWWTDEDLAAFKARTQVLVEQYAAFEPLEGVNLNGELTLGENIGDLGGLTVAYKAYQLSLDGQTSPTLDGFTGEQRFFIGWAQAFAAKYTEENLRNRIKTAPHSPAQYRVNGVVRNMPEFVEAFSLTENDGLYLAPEQRVKIW